MALSFAYKRVRISSPALALGGQMSRPRALIGVTLIGQGGATTHAQGMIDTGSDDAVFPEATATKLGIDLTSCPTGSMSTAGGIALPIRYASVTLRITDGIEQREWTAMVGFAPVRGHALLGFAGFHRFFTVNLYGDDEIVTLEPNRLYPGT
jgi:hypothetical protein